MPPPRRAPARAAQRVVVGALVALALVGVTPSVALAGMGATGAHAGEVGTVVTRAPGWRGEMLARINAVRAAVGVRPLKPCPALRRSAQEYSMVMASGDHFGHVGPDGSQPVDRMQRTGYRGRSYAENIAAGQQTVEQVMADWVESPGHYANLVNPTHRHVGLGHAASVSSHYGHYWVQNFGRGRGC